MTGEWSVERVRALPSEALLVRVRDGLPLVLQHDAELREWKLTWKGENGYEAWGGPATPRKVAALLNLNGLATLTPQKGDQA